MNGNEDDSQVFASKGANYAIFNTVLNCSANGCQTRAHNESFNNAPERENELKCRKMPNFCHSRGPAINRGAILTEPQMGSAKAVREASRSPNNNTGGALEMKAEQKLHGPFGRIS